MVARVRSVGVDTATAEETDVIKRKLIWRVDPAPTGPYRSFATRAWPSAHDSQENPVARILCEDEYRPVNVREGRHRLLRVRVALKPIPGSVTEKKGLQGFTWRTIKGEFARLDDAKEAVQKLYDKHYEMFYREFER
jgi:hypothetical protein